MNIQELEIPVKDLRRECDPASFSFRTTSDLDPSEEVIGQQRAVKAIEFGLSIRNHGYNLFVSGVPGTGKNTIVKSLVKRISLERPVPDALEILGEPHVAMHELDAVGDVVDQAQRPRRGQVVDDDHLIAARDQGAGEIRADESRPPVTITRICNSQHEFVDRTARRCYSYCTPAWLSPR